MRPSKVPYLNVFGHLKHKGHGALIRLKTIKKFSFLNARAQFENAAVLPLGEKIVDPY
jgi:hypothetical protein